ncbi:MAG: phytoene/squalene synthase family protein [Chelatococcus sp.]|uniref:phytoene/squalene synthase family protein n=1 Tax=Chelatococcus sp. TaxID=1953771 RepID=UPI0025C3674F|nr:phytoene/squalene synthase family protein [Chelatococcus sp.]MBX3537841.1 phytoene/squalene synthase family protein [Chelatococcus sp.]
MMADGAGPGDDAALSAAFSHCEQLVREADIDRFLAGLFIPVEMRRYCFALYAFSHEIARVRELVNSPLPGELRYQWWRDALGDEEARGDVAAHPVAAAVLATIARFKLPRQALLDLIDARIFDLYDDPMGPTSDLEGYSGETTSALLRLASLILADGEDAGAADAAGHLGVAQAVTGLIRALPWHLRRGQVYVPADILAEAGLPAATLLAGERTPALAKVIAAMRSLAERHYRAGLDGLAQVPSRVRPVYLPAMLVPAYLREFDRRDYDPYRSIVDLPQWRKQWLLWRASRRLR